MMLPGIAAACATIALAASVGTGRKSAVGKVLAVVAAAIGITLGITVGTVADASGAAAETMLSVATISGASAVFAGNVAVRKLLKRIR